MIQRTQGAIDNIDVEDIKEYKRLDYQEACDNCGNKIGSERYIMITRGKVYCSHKCTMV